MTSIANNSIVNIALFVIQIVSAASGFVISASCLFLRKWHPPIAYTAAFHISFWIGVQAMITHTGSAISVRLPESSDSMQQNKPLVRFLVWAQFAMPLWFVFLNVAIATDLMLSQLFRLNATKLQALHKWYLPVTTLIAFALALPLLIYHSAYRPEANVFSVQFPSALSVTLYYILAFDIWLAIGIMYCFVVVSVVVGVLLLKLRRKRAAWRQQNAIQNTWLPLTPTGDVAEPSVLPKQVDNRAVSGVLNCVPNGQSLKALESACDEIKEENDCEDSDGHIDPNQVRTFMQPLPPLPVTNTDARKTLSVHVNIPCASTAMPVPANPSDTLMSGVTFNEDTDIRIYHVDRPASVASGPTTKNSTAQHRHSELFKASTVSTANPNTYMENGCLPFRYSKIGKHSLKSYLSLRKSTDHHRRSDITNTSEHPNGRHSEQTQASTFNGESETRTRRLLLKLNNLPPQLTLRSKSRLLLSSGSITSPFRIPTLALFRLLLYPLIPIFSFTLMCVVRWVWFRSTMPSRWEILNVVSGFLRALEGFFCLIVFLLNPALNRSFREIRKRNTPVFSQ